MREIKFQGKRVDNGEWVYGVPVIGITSGVLMVWIESEAKRGRGELSIRDVVKQAEVIPETVGQDTGLKDRNGVEIYEGDVIQEFAGEHAQGVWEFSNVSVVEDLRWMPESLGFADCTYIIGNIHENPELMKEKK